MSGLLDFITPGVGSVLSGAMSGIASLFGGMNAQKANSASAWQQFMQNSYLMNQQNQLNVNDAALAEQWTQENMANANMYNQQSAAQQQQYNETNLGLQWGVDQDLMQRQFNANQSLQSNAQDFSAQQAAIQRDYETQMSNTAMQRQVAGMKAAGLNPILGVSTSGATTPNVTAPSGTSASVGLPTVGQPSAGLPTISGPAGPSASASLAGTGLQHYSDVVTPAVTSALKGFNLVNEFNQATSSIAKTQADTANAAKQGNLIDANVRDTNASANLKNAQAIAAGMQPDAIRASVNRDNAAADASKSQVGYNQAGATELIRRAATDDATASAQSAQAQLSQVQAARTALKAQMDAQYGDTEHPTSQIMNPGTGQFTGNNTDWVHPPQLSDMERALSTTIGVGNSPAFSNVAGNLSKVFKLLQH